jgi:hypothetical protein
MSSLQNLQSRPQLPRVDSQAKTPRIYHSHAKNVGKIDTAQPLKKLEDDPYYQKY